VRQDGRSDTGTILFAWCCGRDVLFNGNAIA
jgi:hypothetical protein